MEYIQTILFQIPASRLEEATQADGLLSSLDGHRTFLRTQPGFRDMRLTRSINNDGNILVLVETRWSDDSSLVRYETNEPNMASIARGFRHVIVPDSLQVLDMEALRTESSFKPAEDSLHARERVILPIAIPLACLAFALLAIYGLSRIYLEIGGDGAVALAGGIAIAVLLIAFYLAMNPKVPGWQIAGVFVLVAGALAGGTIWALVEEDDNAEGEEQVDGGAEPGGGEPSGSPVPGGEEPVGLVISMGDNFFEFDGERNPTVTVPAGSEISLPNDGTAIHNLRVTGTDGEFDSADDVLSDPDLVRGGQEAVLVAELDSGEYDFRCDFHPTDMTGTLVVE